MSVTAAPVRFTLAFGLFNVMIKVEVPPGVMSAGENALLNVGGLAAVSEALDVLPVPPLAEETVTLLFLTPAVVAVTIT